MREYETRSCQAVPTAHRFWTNFLELLRCLLLHANRMKELIGPIIRIQLRPRLMAGQKVDQDASERVHVGLCGDFPSADELLWRIEIRSACSLVLSFNSWAQKVNCKNTTYKRAHVVA